MKIKLDFDDFSKAKYSEDVSDYDQYGDDSSDEEIDKDYQKNFYLKLNNKVSSVIKPTLAKITLHPSLQCFANEKDIEESESILNELLKTKNFLSPAQKVSKAKEAVDALNKKLNLTPDSPAKKAIIEVYNNTKLKNISAFKAELKAKLSASPSSIIRSDEKLEIDLEWSKILLDFGVKLLHSKKVTSIYYSAKASRYKKYDKLPNDEKIKKSLAEVIVSLLKEEECEEVKDEVLNSDAYKNLEDRILSNKRIMLNNKLIKYVDKELSELMNTISRIFSSLNMSSDITTEELFNVFSDKYNKKVEKLQKTLTRPVLPDSISSSFKYIRNGEKYNGYEDLLCHLRLTHSSTKRYIKNSKQQNDFEGAEFSWGWQFNPDKPMAVIDCISLNKKSLSLNNYVKYPCNSDYSSLSSKLSQYIKDNDVAEESIAQAIKSILKTGTIPEDLNISESFERFLNIFTHHLFGTEVQRHPAAAIHHAIGLDLVKDLGFEWMIEHLPMALPRAVTVARSLQISLNKNLLLPYFYDKAKKLSAPTETEEFQKFVITERKLIKTWLDKNNLIEDWLDINDLSIIELNDKILLKFDDLCLEYFGISLIDARENEKIENFDLNKTTLLSALPDSIDLKNQNTDIENNSQTTDIITEFISSSSIGFSGESSYDIKDS